MPTKVDELYVEVTTKAERLDAGLRSTVQKVDAAAGRMQQSLTKVDAAFANLGRGFAVAALPAALLALTKGAIDAADRINDLSQRTGVAVETLSGFGYVAKLSGTDVEIFANALSKMNKTLGDAAASDAAAQKIERLGLSVKNLLAMRPEEQFLAIADKISQLGTQAEKTKATMDVFGRSGAELIPIFEGGADAIRGMLDEAERLGVAFSAEEAAKIARFNDALDTMQARVQALARDGFLVLYDAVVKASDAYNRFTSNNQGLSAGGAKDALSSRAQEIAELTARLEHLAKVEADVQSGALSGYSAPSQGTIDKRRLETATALRMARNEYNELSRVIGEQYGPAEQQATKTAEESVKVKDKQTQSLKRYSAASATASKSAEALAHKQAELDRQFRDVLDGVAERYDDLVKEETRANLEAIEKMAEEVKRQAEESMRPFEHAFENVQDALADMLVEGKFSFESLAGIAKRLAAEVASAWVIKPILSSVTGGGSGTDILGSITGVAKGGGSGLVGSTLATIGGNFISNALFGGDRGMGADIGGMVGGAAGSFVGGPIGGFIGSTLGNLVGGLFGGGQPHPASTFGGQLGAGGALDVSYQSKHAGTEVAQSLAQQVAAIAGSLAAAGIDLAGTEIHGGTDVGRFGGKGFFGVGGLDKTIQFDPNDPKSLDNALGRLAVELASTADIADDRLRAALEHIQIEGKGAAQVLQEIVDAATFDQRQASFRANLEDEILKLTDPLAYQTKQILAMTDELMKQAVALEVSPALVERWRDTQLAMLDGTNAQQELVRASQQAMEAALRAAEEFAEVQKRLEATLTDALLGADSPLSPEAQLALARGNLDALASASTPEELSRLSDAFNTFIEQSRALKASTADFKADFAYGQAIIEAAIQRAGGQAATNRAQAAQLSAALSGLTGTQPSASAPTDTTALIGALNRMAQAQEQNNALVRGIAYDTAQAAR